MERSSHPITVQMGEGLVAVQSGGVVQCFGRTRQWSPSGLTPRQLLVMEVDLKMALDEVRTAIENEVRPLP